MQGEPGLDYGGLRKEFFTVLQTALFQESGLFVPQSKLLIKRTAGEHYSLTAEDEALCFVPTADFNNIAMKGEWRDNIAMY